jgi:glycosyltransferase involved in cell wall biosynthesis
VIAAPFISIIVPFHNSAQVCGPLLKTLAPMSGRDGIELIFVDDGSTDETPTLLRRFAQQSKAPLQIIERSRGGPGAARNSGLDLATGKFVWFVDSDDNIDLDTVSLAKIAQWPEVDLVAWAWEHPRIVRRLAPGLHSTRDGPTPPDVLDPIVCNWFSRSFLLRTRLRFPEYCFYEATPLEAFALPLLVENYLKVNVVAYLANTETPSVTRGPPGFVPGYYDRLKTISLGMSFVDQAQISGAARRQFEEAFIRLYLWYTVRISPTPGSSWVLATRIMRQYRDEAKRFGVCIDPLELYPGRRASGLVMRFLWYISAGLPSQKKYFDGLRERLWGRDIGWEAPELPTRWRKRAG